MDFLGLIVSIVIAAIVSGFVIWIVGKLGLGLEVTGFGPAFIAAIVIAVVSGVIYWLLGLFGLAPGGGWLGALISLIIAAVVLMISDRFVAGMKVNGFVGAIVAAIAIGVVWWLVAWVLGLFGLVV
jgi:putative membrane protein